MAIVQIRNVALAFLFLGCRVGVTDEEQDAQSPRNNPVKMLMMRADKAGPAADPWALMLPPGVLNDIGIGGATVPADICQLDFHAPLTDVREACVKAGSVTEADSDSACLGKVLDRDYEVAAGPALRSLSVAASSLCRAKGMGFVPPSRKSGVVDLSDQKGMMSKDGSDRYNLDEGMIRSEKQTKGMYRFLSRGTLVDRGIRFVYEIVHMPHDKWNRESGGRIVALEQKGDRSVVVTAIYSIEEGTLSLRLTTAEFKALAPEKLAEILNPVTGLVDASLAATSHADFVGNQERWDVLRDFHKANTNRAMLRLGDNGTSRPARVVAGRFEGIRVGKESTGCGVLAVGSNWSTQGSIVPQGFQCAANGKIERFAQSQCFSYSNKDQVWALKDNHIAFGPQGDCGFGTPAFNLELLNDDGNTADIQSFETSLPSLPGISPAGNFMN